MNWILRKAELYPEDLAQLHFILGKLEAVAYSVEDPSIQHSLFEITKSMSKELDTLNQKTMSGE